MNYICCIIFKGGGILPSFSFVHVIKRYAKDNRSTTIYIVYFIIRLQKVKGIWGTLPRMTPEKRA